MFDLIKQKIKKLTTQPIVYNEILYDDQNYILDILDKKGIEVRWIGFNKEGYLIIEDKIGEKSFSDILKENRKDNKESYNKNH